MTIAGQCRALSILVDIPSGGRYKPNKRTYKQVLKSGEIADECMEQAEPYRGDGVRIKQTSDRNRVKVHVYANKISTLGAVHPITMRISRPNKRKK